MLVHFQPVVIVPITFIFVFFHPVWRSNKHPAPVPVPPGRGFGFSDKVMSYFIRTLSVPGPQNNWQELKIGHGARLAGALEVRGRRKVGAELVAGRAFWALQGGGDASDGMVANPICEMESDCGIGAVS